MILINEKKLFSLCCIHEKVWNLFFYFSEQTIVMVGTRGFGNMDGLIRLRICQQNLRQVSNKEDLLEEILRNIRRKYINLILRKASTEKNVEQIS